MTGLNGEAVVVQLTNERHRQIRAILEDEG